MTEYPIAETFHSVQGEGVWTGTPMFFIRLAGCNVGKYDNNFPEAPELVYDKQDFPLFESHKHSICTTHQGEQFLCDTDYHSHTKLNWLEIEDELVAPHLPLHTCITGGEPFLHDLYPLVDHLQESRQLVHIETSGTKHMPSWTYRGEGIKRRQLWITCCPKAGFLAENYHIPHEWKFLAGPGFDPQSVKDFLLEEEKRPVFIQPINGVNEVDQEAVARCLEIVKRNPSWRLSAQLHKYLQVR